jgi:nitric oxide dioxygenase
MLPRQIALVQNSFERAALSSEQLAQLFHDRLFEIAPEVRPLFKGDLRRQGVVLMQTLGIVVRGLDDFGSIMPVAALLAIRHVEYGVREQHYTAVGEALLFALERVLGDAFTPEVRGAWDAVYGVLSAMMIGAAYRNSAAA